MTTELFVSPQGNDSNPGTKSKPLATLAAARDAVRKLKKPAKGDITVWIAGGTYPIRQTVVFGLEDSAAGGRVVYSAVPGQEPVLSAGVRIAGWRKVEGDLPGLPAKARGKVYQADLPQGLGTFHTLFCGLTRLPRARCEGFTPPVESTGWTGETADARTQMPFPPGAMKNWANIADVEFSIVPAAPWTMNVLPVESIDTQKNIVRTAFMSTYALTKPRFGKFQSGSVFVENVFEGMNKPRTWVVDSKARKVYLWAESGKLTPNDKSKAEPRVDLENIFAPCLTELVRVEGKIDVDAPQDTPVRGIVLRGLTFAHGERFTWTKDHVGWGLQHDWEMYDAPSAMLRFRGVEKCAVEACRFTASGGTAVRLDLHCMDNRVTDCVIEHVGGAGVLLAGYGLGTKDVNKRNAVVNNHIHHVGETYWHSSGIFAWQSGENVIANNLIHNMPYTGIVASGRICPDPNGVAECSRSVRTKEVAALLGDKPHTWHNREPLMHSRRNQIERNEIRDVMEVLEDGNCIYISGAGGGNVVRNNFLHHCESIHMAEGIRCDDDQHATLIEGNILWRIGGLASFIAIKGVNDVVNNIMAVPVQPPMRGMLSLECAPINWSLVERNIYYAVSRKDKAIGQGMTYYRMNVWLRDTRADYNLYFNAADAKWGQRLLDEERQYGIESHSVAADPEFVDLEKGDFRLKKTSPALKMGFVPIDQKGIGLQRKVGPQSLKK
ncbi:MAG: right-handed parallel beta-helix repeat-containing protein [Planctomycetaceae bacterium]|nr:right-handed parallel beta-helix repeat-containing protein [Planctomycetaceae bacterium]